MQINYGIRADGFILPMMVVVSGSALVIGAGLAGTMQPFGQIAGVAFSAVGFIKFMFSAVLGMVLMWLPISPLILGAMIASLSAICIMLCIIYRHTLVKQVSTENILLPTIE